MPTALVKTRLTTKVVTHVRRVIDVRVSRKGGAQPSSLTCEVPVTALFLEEDTTMLCICSYVYFPQVIDPVGTPIAPCTSTK